MSVTMDMKIKLFAAGLAGLLMCGGTVMPVAAACQKNCGNVPEAVVVIPEGTICDISDNAVTGAAQELAKQGMVSEAVRMLDEAAEAQRKQHKGTPYATGPLVWAARSIRDLGRPMSALVRYQSILGRLQANPDPAWSAIVHEDIGGIQAGLGMNEKAYASYAAAMKEFNETNNQDAVRRVSLKMPSLLQ